MWISPTSSHAESSVTSTSIIKPHTHTACTYNGDDDDDDSALACPPPLKLNMERRPLFGPGRAPLEALLPFWNKSSEVERFNTSAASTATSSSVSFATSYLTHPRIDSDERGTFGKPCRRGTPRTGSWELRRPASTIGAFGSGLGASLRIGHGQGGGEADSQRQNPNSIAYTPPGIYVRS